MAQDLTQPLSREEFEARHQELKDDLARFKEEMQRDAAAFKKDILSRIDQLTTTVQKDHDNFLEWKGRALLMMYVIPALTGIIGFLLGVHF